MRQNRNQRIIIKLLLLVRKVDNRIDKLPRILRAYTPLAPDKLLIWQRLHIIPSDNPEIAPTPLQRPPQILILILIRMNDRPIGKHNLEVRNGITSKPFLRHVISRPAPKQEPANTNIAIASSCGNNTVFMQRGIHILPFRARPDTSNIRASVV